jgi:hypothetical protein
LGEGRLWEQVRILTHAGLEPDEWQAGVLRSDAQRMLLLASRQAGKSSVAAALALRTALLRPRSPVLLLSPSLRQSGELYRKVVDLFGALGRPMGVSAESALRLELSNGSRVVSLPGDEKNIRGFSGVALLIIDEAARVEDPFETETLSPPRTDNLKHLMDLSGQWIDQAHRHRKLTKLILDMDSSVSETYGHQEETAYNGYFAYTCYHPLFLFNQFGDLERVMLRRGNHPSAKFWRRVLLPVIERYRDRDIPKYFRGDSAFALPKLLRLLENEGFRYAIRIKANPVLQREVDHLLKRPVGRPSRKPKKFYASFRYRAGSWDQARRVVAKVE